MARGVGGQSDVREVSTAVAASRRSRLLQAVLAAAAIIALLAFVHVLRPGASEVTVASGTLRTLDSVPDGRMPPPVPAGPAAPAPVAQDVGNGDDVTPVDDDDSDSDQAEEQQQEEQQQQDQFDETQEQLQTDEENEQQAEQDSEKQAQKQNDEAQQQVDEGLQQAEQDEIDAGQ